MVSKTKKVIQSNDINLFGIHFKPWQGIVAGILIQMIFTNVIVGPISQVIAGFGGLLIIGSVVVAISNRLNKKH